jgi:hypothetical protein
MLSKFRRPVLGSHFRCPPVRRGRIDLGRIDLDRIDLDRNV